jgi:hypothetical protein
MFLISALAGGEQSTARSSCLPQNAQNSRMGGPQIWSRLLEEKKLFPVKKWTLDYSTQSKRTIPTEDAQQLCQDCYCGQSYARTRNSGYMIGNQLGTLFTRSQACHFDSCTHTPLPADDCRPSELHMKYTLLSHRLSTIRTNKLPGKIFDSMNNA